MRQPYFALILFITSLRKGGRAGEAQERRVRPCTAHIAQCGDKVQTSWLSHQHLPSLMGTYHPQQQRHVGNP